MTPVPPRNVSAVRYYWNAAAPVSYLRDAFVVQLPISELTDDGVGVA
jgi:hypothetical protein